MSLVVTRSDMPMFPPPHALQRLEALTQAARGDYAAMVCLFMVGGNDGNNLLVPMDQHRHAAYRRQRPQLALARDELLPLHLGNAPAGSYGLHPALGGLQRLVNSGQAAMLANVGPLVVPTTRRQWHQRSVPVPMNLFSHGDQQVAWQSGVVDGAPRSGWGGRLVERLVAERTPRRGFSMLSVAGGNLWSAGDRGLQACRVRAYGRMQSSLLPRSPAPVALAMKPAPTPAPVDLQSLVPAVRRALEEQAQARAADLEVMSQSAESRALLAEALDGVALRTAFPATSLGQQLAMVARFIAARGGLGLQKQCFFCAIDGFDTHGDDQLQRQQAAFAEIGAAVEAFHAATVEMGVADQVTLFSASDFGRTFASNGQGTDHGWGNHHFVVGGAVQGGRLVGRFPELALGGPDDAGNGVWIPTLASDQVAADVGRWFGADAQLLDEVFPTLRHFDRSIGLMA